MPIVVIIIAIMNIMPFVIFIITIILPNSTIHKVLNVDSIVVVV